MSIQNSNGCELTPGAVIVKSIGNRGIERGPHAIGIIYT